MKPIQLDPNEWYFGGVPKDLLWNCWECELARERFRDAQGLTSKALVSRWPWFPRPWLAGWRELSAEAKTDFLRRVQTRRPPLEPTTLPDQLKLVGQRVSLSELHGAELETDE
ncbi:MAG: hypothetical protein ACKOET_10945, partial [Verrucomicrobiota bacterium]